METRRQMIAVAIKNMLYRHNLVTQVTQQCCTQVNIAFICRYIY